MQNTEMKRKLRKKLKNNPCLRLSVRYYKCVKKDEVNFDFIFFIAFLFVFLRRIAQSDGFHLLFVQLVTQFDGVQVHILFGQDGF